MTTRRTALSPSPVMPMRLHAVLLAAFLATPLAAQQAATAPAAAQPAVADSSLLTVRRIYASPEFSSENFGPARWLDGGRAYTTVERAAAGGRGREIVRYETRSGAREVMIAAAQLTPPGDTMPLAIEDYSWSPDGNMLLVFTNSQPVWRTNSRGDYWVLDRRAGPIRKLGGPDAKPSTLMFAKFSPDGRKVGYVRENNLYVEGLADGAIVQLTKDGSRMSLTPLLMIHQPSPAEPSPPSLSLPMTLAPAHPWPRNRYLAVPFLPFWAASSTVWVHCAPPSMEM